MKKVALYTLGCKLNFSETSSIGRQFEQKGYQKVPFEASADIYIINTCTVTDHADKKCKKVVKEALKYNPKAFVAVVGCYAQLKPQEIIEIPGVDVVLGAAEKFRLLELIDDFTKSKEKKIYHSPIEEAKSYYTSYSINDRTRTFLKVQDGCDYTCSFCTIPLARGKSRSDSIENIVKAAEDISRSGVKEIVLTGVNIGDYGIIGGDRIHKFLDLINALDQIEGIERFRISSIEPNLCTDEIIEFVAKSIRFVPHFHMPLQSGSDKILKSMRRRYLSALYADRVRQIKQNMPHACIGVDVITGYPGESEEDFLETYTFLNELDISYLHVFTYSERDNTHAINLGNFVPQKGRDERTNQLRSLSEKKRRYFYESHLQTTRDVLFEANPENGYIFGFTDNYIKVKAKYDPLWVNEIKPVKLQELGPDGIMHVEDAEIFLHHI